MTTRRGKKAFKLEHQIFKSRKHKPREKTRIELIADIILEEMKARGCVLENPKSADVVYASNYLIKKSLLAPVFKVLGITQPKHLGRSFYRTSLKNRSLFFKHVMVCYYHHYVDPVHFNRTGKRTGIYINFKSKDNARERINTCWRIYKLFRRELWQDAERSRVDYMHAQPVYEDPVVAAKIRAITEFKGPFEIFHATLGRNMLPPYYAFALLWHQWHHEPLATQFIKEFQSILYCCGTSDSFTRGLISYAYREQLRELCPQDFWDKWTVTMDGVTRTVFGHTLKEMEVVASARATMREEQLQRMYAWELMDDIPQEYHDAISRALEPPSTVSEPEVDTPEPDVLQGAPVPVVRAIPKPRITITRRRRATPVTFSVTTCLRVRGNITPRHAPRRGPPMRGSPPLRGSPVPL